MALAQQPTPDKRPNRPIDATSRQPPKPPSHFEKRRQLAASARPEAAVASSTPWNGGLHACFWARRTCWKVLCEFKLAPAFRESKQPSSLATVASRIQSRLSARRWHYWLVACCGAGLRECREASPVRSSSCGRSAAIRTRRLERFGWGSRRRVGSRLRVSSIGTVRGGTRAGPLVASIAVVRGRGTMRSDVFGSITLIGRSSGPRSCKPKRPIAPKIWGHVPDTWADWWRDS